MAASTACDARVALAIRTDQPSERKHTMQPTTEKAVETYRVKMHLKGNRSAWVITGPTRQFIAKVSFREFDYAGMREAEAIARAFAAAPRLLACLRAIMNTAWPAGTIRDDRPHRIAIDD